MSNLSADNEFQIDFNFHQVPSALSVNIPIEAAAAMLNITSAQFTAYTDKAFTACQTVATHLLDNPATAQAIRKLKIPCRGEISTVMTVGDSITTYRYGYAEILRALLGMVAPDQSVAFYNHGRSGYTSTHGLEHTYTQYLAQQPDWVFLKYGANDTKRFGGKGGKLLVTLDEYTANMTNIIDAFLKSGSRVIVMTATPIVEEIVNTNPDFQAINMTWDNTDLKACAEEIKTIASKRNVPYIDLVELFGMKPDPSLYVPDGLHPSPVGHQLIIKHVLDAINSYS